MFTYGTETKPRTDYWLTTGTGTGDVDWVVPNPAPTPCNSPWGSYGGCPYRLPCGRCRKTGQMCPVNGGYYVTWC